jgi:hypothetical protein
MGDIVKHEGPAPWERQPGESAHRYNAFCEYRKMPRLDRSLRGLAALLGRRDHGTLGKWSAEGGWQARVEAWDMHMDALEREAQEQRIREIGTLRAEFAIDALTSVMTRLRGDEEKRIAPLDLNKLDAKDIAALANVADKIGAAFDRTKADDAANRDVNVRVSFDMTPHYGAETAGVVIHTPLPPAEGDE